MEKQFDLPTVAMLERKIRALKAKADEGKKIIPKDVNELATIMDAVMPELQQRCDPVKP